MNRRDFMQAIAGSAGILTITHRAWALTSPVPTQRKLIVVMLRGAVDGLNVVVPYGDANYAQLRPAIAIPRPGEEGGALDLDGYFGLHPALASLQALWNERKLAFVHAAGSPDETRSHFDAQDYMESGTPGKKNTPDGWMNRLLSLLPGEAAPTRAISVGALMPRILAGHAAATNIASGAAAMRPTVLDRPNVASGFDRLYSGDDALARAYRQAQDTRREVMASLEEEMRMANGGAPLPNGFPDDAARIAALMRKDPKVQMAFVALGGWDTHVNQGAAKGQLANRLAPLGEGLAVLAQRLGPAFDDTVIVVMSEFGRTARQNGNNGTDHGHGNAMWLLGGRVGGGKVYGDWRGLDATALHEGRDLPVTTDFRSVLAAIAERHWRLSDRQLQQLFPTLPDHPPLPGLLRA